MPNKSEETAQQQFSKYAALTIDWWIAEKKAEEVGANDVASTCEASRKFCQEQAEKARAELNNPSNPNET